MDRRAFIDAIARGLLVFPLAASSQPMGKVWRIGLIAVRPPANPEHVAARHAFKQVLHQRGYVEGKNLVYEERYTEGSVGRELVINLKTAKALGLTIPQSMLLRADEEIQ